MRILPTLAAMSLLAFGHVPVGAVAAQADEQQQTQDQDAPEAEPVEEGQRDNAPVVPEAEDAKKPKKICKRIKNVGTRFSEKVCLTKEQWDSQRDQTQDAAREARRNK